MLLRVLMSSAYAPVYTLQEVVGEKDPKAGPKVMRHTVVAPLPMVEKTSQGVLEVPEKIQCWKGSVFSIFSRGVANWDGSGYGALLQTPSVCATPISAHIVMCQEVTKC